MNLLITIEQLRQQGIFSDLDVSFARFITQLSDDTDDELLLGVVLASYFTSQGHICVDLSQQAGQFFPPASEQGIATLSCPTLSNWLDSLQKSSIVGQVGDYTPLILDKHRLYLYRYWYYEQQLVAQIHERYHLQNFDLNHELLEESLSRLFPDPEETRQKTAARTAVLSHFCIISGGPGTGKTSTIAKILWLLLEQQAYLNIVLAAPTGKAAVRLQEAISQALNHFNHDSSIKAALPQEAYTIHRLLGRQSDAIEFRNRTHSSLPFDVVVIDEASMVDLALMAKLSQAIPQSARWILLGDKDQLASVEVGTVLGDICEAAIDSSNPLQKNIVLLEKNYRFDKESGIWTLAQAVKQGKGEQALRILKSENYPDVNWYPLEGLPTLFIQQIVTFFSQSLTEQSPEILLQQFETFRILCATRQGRYGVENINRRIAEELSRQRLIQPNARWYHGQPIMITHNDYNLKLFNGEVGIILRNPVNRYELQAFFPATDGPIRTFWPHRLPEHETVFAMTIHKSQGSEFDNVFILLPEQFSNLLTRELIYTGITRARQQVTIWGHEPVFKKAISQQISRSSGLREHLNDLMS